MWQNRRVEQEEKMFLWSKWAALSCSKEMSPEEGEVSGGSGEARGREVGREEGGVRRWEGGGGRRWSQGGGGNEQVEEPPWNCCCLTSVTPQGLAYKNLLIISSLALQDAPKVTFFSEWLTDCIWLDWCDSGEWGYWWPWWPWWPWWKLSSDKSYLVERAYIKKLSCDKSQILS